MRMNKTKNYISKDGLEKLIFERDELQKVERPKVVNGQIEIRPVMYLALSYDHRIVDGKEAVSFLKIVKDSLEQPKRLFLNI